MDPLELFIGNKRISSWSLRPWLALRMANAPFVETVVPFHAPDFRAIVDAVSPSGKVPALRHGSTLVWDSLAICEYVAELFPEAALLPQDRRARATVRAVSTEMHAGFQSLRAECSMDVLTRKDRHALSLSAQRDVARVRALWADCRARFGAGGPFLFGAFTLADAMFAPVATRFQTFGIEADDVSRAYIDAITALPAMKEWAEAARAEIDWPITAAGAIQTFADAEAFARAWAEAWSQGALEEVLSHFAEGVVFISPRAQSITGAATVRGKADLRRYWAAALEKVPTRHFAVEDVSWDSSNRVLVIRYVVRAGTFASRAVEMMRFEGDLVVHGEALYGATL